MTTQTEQEANLESEIAAEMGEEDTETTEEPQEDVTGPGPDSPFQPPDLHPDEDEESESEEAAETESEDVEDYAPGVAEARLLSEREAEALGKKLDAERKRHGKRVMELLGDDLGGHIPCPTCMDGIDGFIVSPEFAPLDIEQRTRMMQILGLDDFGSMSTAPWASQCETCLGYGSIKTGSHVPGRETAECEDCAGAGYVNTRKRAMLAAVPVDEPSGQSGPTVYQDHEPDPRVDALRRDGFTVIPPMVMTNAGS
jgi:hypothetical protein